MARANSGSGELSNVDVEVVEADIDGKNAVTTNSLVYGRASAGVTHPIDASPANTARTTGTTVQPVQGVDDTGKVSPAGDAVGNSPFSKITDGENILKLQHMLARVPEGSVYIVGVHKGTYTVNNGSWNIDYTGFTGLTVENFPFGIINLSTGQVYSTTNATLTATEIQLVSGEQTGLTAPATGNLLFIPIVQDVRAYDDSLDLTKIAEQAPLDSQILDETLLSAVTATGRSSFTNVTTNKGLTFCIVATNVTLGATFIFEGSPDATAANTQGLQAKNSSTGAVANSFNITANGTYYFQIDENINPKYVDVNLSARTDGTYTVYLFGKVL